MGCASGVVSTGSEVRRVCPWEELVVVVVFEGGALGGAETVDVSYSMLKEDVCLRVSRVTAKPKQGGRREENDNDDLRR